MALVCDITPVKSSRRDSMRAIRLGEDVGAATPAVYCPNHNVQSFANGSSKGKIGLFVGLGE
jgi:hypothetical protein